MLCCPLVDIHVITTQTHLSGFVCVRDSDPVGGVWNVVVWLVLVNVLNRQIRNLLQLRRLVPIKTPSQDLITLSSGKNNQDLLFFHCKTKSDINDNWFFATYRCCCLSQGLNILAPHAAPPPSWLLTALSDRDSVCKMSNMVFNTRPLHSRWGNLVEVEGYKKIHVLNDEN